MNARQKKLIPETMQALRNRPGFTPLKIADTLWPGAVKRSVGTGMGRCGCRWPAGFTPGVTDGVKPLRHWGIHGAGP